MEIVRQKNVATYITFPIVDADGDFVTGATALDSEIDQWSDGSSPTGFADCTNEATEIGTTGVYYLSLTQTEMNDDYIVIQVKTTSSGAKTQLILIRTMVGDPLNFAVTDDGTAINVASGIVEAQVKSIDANAITAASIATGAIDADAIADNAIDAGAIAADAITAAKIAADAGTEIGTAVWATAARTLTALDEDSTTLDLDATIRSAVGLAAANLDTQLDALPTAAENADAVWDEDATAHQTGGTFGQAIGDPGADTNTIFKAVVTDAAGATVGVDTTAILEDTGTTLQAELDGIQADTEDIQTRLPAALVGGRMDSNVQAMAAGVVTAAAVATGAIDADALAADAVAEIADGVWDEATSGHTTAGSTGKALTDAGAAGTPPTAAEVADAVWDEVQSGHNTSGTFGVYLDSAVSAAGAVAIQNPGGRGQGMTPAQADDIAKRTWNVEVAEGKTAKQVLLEAAMPEEDKPGYDDTAMKDVMTQMAKMLGDMSSKDTTAPVLEALANLDKPADYTQNFESMGKRFDEVMAAVGAVMPNLVEFADRVNSVGADMSDANAAIQETLDKIHVLDGDFAELQGLVDAFKDKLEEQVDMDKRVAALGGKLNDKALAELSNKITDMQRMLLAKIENTKFDILKSL